MSDEAHVMPVKTYLTVFAALMVLTVITVAVAFVDLGPFNVMVAVTIAAVKAYVVVLYFMHVKYSNKVIWLSAVAGFIWFGLMLALTFSDYATRDWIPAPGAW